MTGRRSPRPRTAAALVAAVALAAGCSLLRPSGQEAGGQPPGPATRADTAEAGTADTVAAAARSDTAPRARPAVGDSALQALRDSARAMQERRRHGADSVRSDTASADDRRRAAGDSAGAYPHGPVTVTSVDSLESIGPVYTPYDRGPVMRTGDYLNGLLKAALVPVIQRQDLSPETWARFWVLVGPEGRVRATEMHLGSGHAFFDTAAQAVAERLRYLPAERDGRPVPVWVLARVSLLMG